MRLRCWGYNRTIILNLGSKKAVKRIFKTDQPIEFWRDDILGRTSFAKAVGEAILSYKEKIVS